MKKAKNYPARLILFGDEFSENLPEWLEGMVEEYDLTQPTALRFCEEASILHDYVSYFDKEYKQARIVYHFNEKGLTLHRLYTFGPCFKVASSADSQKLQRYSKQLYRFIEIDDLCYQSRLISRDFCQQTKLNKASELKQKLELAFEEFEGGQYCFLHLAKMAITEFINLNFSV